MDKQSLRKYEVLENAPVYTTKDIDKTRFWFEEVLGWYSAVDRTDENGIAQYGSTFAMPEEESLRLGRIWIGIHLVLGEPKQETISLIKVSDVYALYNYATSKGWTKISEVEDYGWGKFCSITTIDGCRINFFE